MGCLRGVGLIGHVSGDCMCLRKMQKAKNRLAMRIVEVLTVNRKIRPNFALTATAIFPVGWRA